MMTLPSPQPSRLIIIAVLASLEWFSGSAISLRAEVVAETTGTPTTSLPVGYYGGGSIIDVVNETTPKPQIQTFTVPNQDYTLNSVVLDMGNASSALGGFSVSVRTVSQNPSTGVSLDLVEMLTGSSDPATAGLYTYTASGTTTLKANTDYYIFADVSAGGGVYNWNSVGGPNFIIVQNGVVGLSLLPLTDLSNVVLFALSPGGTGPLYTVNGTPLTEDEPAEEIVAPTILVPVAVVERGGSKPAPVAVLLSDLGAISSIFTSAAPTALSLRELALNGSQTALRDFNGRLFRLRAGAGATQNTDAGSLAYAPDGTLFETVTIGQGDGDESTGQGKGTQVVIATQSQPAQRWEVFTSFDYGNLDMDPDKNFLGLQSDTYSESIGVEYALTPYLYAGGGVSYLQAFSDQSTDVDGVTLAAYLSGNLGGLYADLLYGATLLSHDIDRKTGLGPTAHADPDSVTHSVNLNTGYNFHFGDLATGPFAGIDYAYASIDGYTESGGGNMATKVSKQSLDSLITRLGWQATYRQKTSWGAIVPQIRIGWERENLSASDDLDVALLNSPFYLARGSSISRTGGNYGVTVQSQERERDYMTAGAGFRLEIGSRFHLTMDYDGHFLSDGYAAHFGKVTLGWKF